MCHVFPPLLSIFGLFPVLVQCDYELILVQLCLSHDLWLSCVFIVLSVQFDVLCYILDDELYPRLRVLRSSLVCALWQKTRPNSKLRPFTSFSFLFLFLKYFVLFLFVCPAAHPSRAFMGDRRRRVRLTQAGHSCEIAAAVCDSPKPGIHGRSTPPSATHPSPPQIQARRPATDSSLPAAAMDLVP